MAGKRFVKKTEISLLSFSFLLANNLAFVDKIEKKGRIKVYCLVLVISSEVENLDSTLLTFWLQKIDNRFGLKYFFIFKNKKDFVIYISCKKMIDTRSYLLFRIQNFTIVNVYLFVEGFDSIVNKNFFRFSSLDLIKRFSFLEFIYKKL